MAPDTVRMIINGKNQPERSPIEASLDFLDNKLIEQRGRIDQEKTIALQEIATQYGWKGGGNEDTKFLESNLNYQLEKKSLQDKFEQRYQSLERIRQGVDQIRAAYPQITKLNLREAQIKNANIHAREAALRATKYVQDVKEYVRNQRQELENRAQQYVTQFQAREQKIREIIKQGIEFLRKFVDTRIDFALERATNRQADDTLIKDLQQAKSAARDVANKIETQFLTLSQVKEALTFGLPEDTKRYREIEKEMEGIEDLLKASPLEEPLDLSPPDVPPSKP